MTPAFTLRATYTNPDHGGRYPIGVDPYPSYSREALNDATAQTAEDARVASADAQEVARLLTLVETAVSRNAGVADALAALRRQVNIAVQGAGFLTTGTDVLAREVEAVNFTDAPLVLRANGGLAGKNETIFALRQMIHTINAMPDLPQ